MSPTPLIDRINSRHKPTQPEPIRITERMSPFMRRLAEKNLPVLDNTGYIRGSFVPRGSDGAA